MLVGILNRSPRFRPTLEEFEDRLTPALYRWMPDVDLNPNLNWNIKEHWWVWDNTMGDYVEQGLNPLIPGGGDDVTFHGIWNGGAGNKDCVMNLARQVKSITVYGGYSKTITLQNTLDIKGPDAKSSGIFLSEGAATLRGSPGVATINMLDNSAFNLGGGNLENLSISVKRAGGMVATANVSDPGIPNRAMLGTVFHIDGQLNWKSGNVDVLQTGTASGINISSAGEFNIGVAGKGWSNRYWGVSPADQSKYFQVQNSGTVTVNATGGTATLRGDFTNANLTQVYAGTLDLAGDIARQTAGVFSLHDTIVKVSGPTQTLNIHEGLIRGSGTVDGNLRLGYDPNGPDAGKMSTAMIDPGFASGFPLVYILGSIGVNQWFEMTSSGNTMQIDVNESGSDIILVGSQAKLKGSLIVNPALTYHPPHPTTHNFLAAAGFVGDFDTKTLTYQGCWMDPGGSGKPVKWSLPPRTSTSYSLVTILVGC